MLWSAIYAITNDTVRARIVDTSYKKCYMNNVTMGTYIIYMYIQRLKNIKNVK